jgi:hypothetical protein
MILNSPFANGAGPPGSPFVLQQFRAAGLYPNVVAPSFNQHGGEVSAGFQLVITAPAGSIYYTINGGDPRQTNQATLYSGPIALPAMARVKARVGITGSVRSGKP